MDRATNVFRALGIRWGAAWAAAATVFLVVLHGTTRDGSEVTISDFRLLVGAALVLIFTQLLVAWQAWRRRDESLVGRLAIMGFGMANVLAIPMVIWMLIWTS